MSLIVKEVTVANGIEDFLEIPYSIYKNDPNRVNTPASELKKILDPSRNPYFLNALLKIYVCCSNRTPVSRSIMVINHLHWKKWNRKTAFFGFFESVNDQEAVNLLFGKIKEESRIAGAEYLEGPFNPNHYSELGILTDNFSSAPLFFESYNPDYYPSLLKSAGFTESSDFHTRINNNISETISGKYRKSVQHDCRNDISIRKFNLLRYKRDLEIMRDVNNDAFEDNQYFLPLSLKEYQFSAKSMFFVSNPGLILIAEYKGQPVGAAHFALNINPLLRAFNGKIMFWDIPALLWKRRKIKELIIFTVAVKKAFRNKRVFARLLKSAIEIFRKYSTVSTTWISDENLGENLYSILDMKPGKHFALYSKKI